MITVHHSFDGYLRGDFLEKEPSMINKRKAIPIDLIPYSTQISAVLGIPLKIKKKTIINIATKTLSKNRFFIFFLNASFFTFLLFYFYIHKHIIYFLLLYNYIRKLPIQLNYR